MNVWRGAVLLKEEKIEHESGQDLLKGITEPTTVRPVVSLYFLPKTPQVTRFKLKKKKKKKKPIIDGVQAWK